MRCYAKRNGASEDAPLRAFASGCWIHNVAATTRLISVVMPENIEERSSQPSGLRPVTFSGHPQTPSCST